MRRLPVLVPHPFTTLQGFTVEETKEVSLIEFQTHCQDSGLCPRSTSCFERSAIPSATATLGISITPGYVCAAPHFSDITRDRYYYSISGGDEDGNDGVEEEVLETLQYLQIASERRATQSPLLKLSCPFTDRVSGTGLIGVGQWC